MLSPALHSAVLPQPAYQCQHIQETSCCPHPCHAALLSEASPVFGPEGLEVNGEADLAAPVHLCCLAFQLWQLNLWGNCWVGGGHVKPEVKLVLDEVVYVPAVTRVCAVSGSGKCR